MIHADLHIHSLYSDGSSSVEEIIQMAKTAHLDCIAITDHERLIQPDEYSNYAKKYKIKVIPGMECGCVDETTGLNVHILAYGIKNPAPILVNSIPILERRHKNTLKQLQILQNLGYNITEEEVRKVTKSPYLYNQHLCYVLWKKGLIDEMFGAWNKQMFGRGGPCYVPNIYPTPKQVIAGITDAGGKAVLAHPGQQNNFCLIEEMVSYGLKGIECVHPSNDEKARNKVKELANIYGLFLTGGSDYHGLYSAKGGTIGKEYITFTDENYEEDIL